MRALLPLLPLHLQTIVCTQRLHTMQARLHNRFVGMLFLRRVHKHWLQSRRCSIDDAALLMQHTSRAALMVRHLCCSIGDSALTMQPWCICRLRRTRAHIGRPLYGGHRHLFVWRCALVRLLEQHDMMMSSMSSLVVRHLLSLAMKFWRAFKVHLVNLTSGSFCCREICTQEMPIRGQLRCAVAPCALGALLPQLLQLLARLSTTLMLMLMRICISSPVLR